MRRRKVNKVEKINVPIAQGLYNKIDNIRKEATQQGLKITFGEASAILDRKIKIPQINFGLLENAKRKKGRSY